MFWTRVQKEYVRAVSSDESPNEAIRRTLRTSGDPRVARTRSAIVAAVHALSDSDDDISVAAVVRTAGISRASFYSHFAGLDELAHALMRDAFSSIGAQWADETGDPTAAIRRAQRRLVDHFVENRGLYAAVAALPISKEAHLANARAMAAVIEQTLRAHPQRPADLAVEAVARYIAGAAYGLIDAWLTGEVVLEDGALVEHLVRLLPPWFSGLQ